MLPGIDRPLEMEYCAIESPLTEARAVGRLSIVGWESLAVTEIQIGFVRINFCRSKCPGDVASVLWAIIRTGGTCFAVPLLWQPKSEEMDFMMT